MAKLSNKKKKKKKCSVKLAVTHTQKANLRKCQVLFPRSRRVPDHYSTKKRMLRKSLRPLLMLSAVQLAALLLFCKGFFPYKTYLPGFATTADAPEILSKTANSNEPQFDRLVFVLVDALRKYDASLFRLLLETL